VQKKNKNMKIQESQALKLPLCEFKDEFDNNFKTGEAILEIAYNLVINNSLEKE
jgi:hypothetical protein